MSILHTVIPSILCQHTEEAAFLWLLRLNATRAPHYTLKDLAKLDDESKLISMASVWLVKPDGNCARLHLAMESLEKSSLPR
jgi:hypothetical protein